MDFVFYFSISPFVLQSLFYLNSGYLFECLQETRVYSLKEHEAVFLKRQNLIWKVEVFRLFFFLFCFFLLQTKYFYKENLNLMFFWGAIRVEGHESCQYYAFSQSKLVKKSGKSYPIFVKLLTFNRSAPSCVRSLLIVCEGSLK